MCGSALALAQLCPRTQYTAASSVTAVSTTCAPIDLPALSVRLFDLLICSHQGERKRGTHRHSLALVHYFWRPARVCRPTARFSAALPHPVVWILIFSIVFSEGCEEDQTSGLATFSAVSDIPASDCKQTSMDEFWADARFCFSLSQGGWQVMVRALIQKPFSFGAGSLSF